MNVSALNQEFGVRERLRFEAGRGDQPQAKLQFGNASASLYLQGAHVASYQPDGLTDLLWLSGSSKFQTEQAIRGGIPVCWPWFGAFDPTTNAGDPLFPQHGYARSSQFDVVAAIADSNSTRMTLRLRSAPSYAAAFEELRLDVEVRLSDQLWIELRTTNTGSTPVDVGAALHSYFAVADVQRVCIPVLTGLTYLDKRRNFARFTQTHDLVIDREVDRVFLDSPREIQVLDPTAARTIGLQCWGNSDLVVWNPGAQNAASLPDFDDDGYLAMICVEPANALANKVTLMPGEQHQLGQTISLIAAT